LELNRLCMGCMTEKPDDEAKCPHCGFVEGTAPESPLYLPPRTVLEKKYLVGRVLGQGGFGITYLAWDINLNVKLAIKEYFPQELASRAAGHSQVSAYSGSMGSQYDYGLDKFLQEARTLAQFEGHPNIVSVRDFFKANGTAYFVMSYVEGITVKEHLANAGGVLPVDQARGILMPVMDALKEVHSVNILHRDISPDNIFINKKGQVILIDFGAARQAIGEKGRSLSIILKPGYAPEEQYRSKGVQGPWTDIYAIAATYYHLVTGKQPPEALERLVDDPLEPPSKLGAALSEDEEKALLKALAVRADDRFQSIQDFQDVLMGKSKAGVIAPAPAVGKTTADNAVKSEKKPIPLGLIIGVIAALVIGGGGYGLWASGVFGGSEADVSADQAVETGPVVVSENGAAAEEDSSPAEANYWGNSGGNIINGGFAATQGEQIFFRSNQGGSLQKGTTGSGETRAISVDSAWFINVSGDNVYYSNRDDNNRIYRVSRNGSNRESLTDNGAWFVTLVDGWLYYLDEADNYRLYRISTGGEGRTRLSEDSAWYICIEDDWIYYVNRDDGDKIYRVSSDAGQKEKINDSSSCCINVVDGWIYYSNEDDGSGIYKMKIDGSENEKVIDQPAWFINVADGWIYYADEDDDFSLNKVRTDGTGRIKLVAEAVRYINVLDEWIIYMDQAEQDTIYKVQHDGSGRNLLESGF